MEGLLSTAGIFLLLLAACLFVRILVVLVGKVTWTHKGNTTVCRNILLIRDRSTFHEKNLASAEPWCHSSLLPLYGKVDPRSVENVNQVKNIFSRC